MKERTPVGSRLATNDRRKSSGGELRIGNIHNRANGSQGHMSAYVIRGVQVTCRETVLVSVNQPEPPRTAQLQPLDHITRS